MEKECPTVMTTGGLLKGKVSKATDSSSKLVHHYLGIPYGKAPIGKRRFLPPEKAEPWKGIFEAVNTYKLCPQDVSVAFAYDELIPFKKSLNHDDNSSDEDCLKLNIFTPEHEKNAKLPVMVWLTGGHYQRNFGGRRNGSPLAGMNDVVVVVPNFRVNAFGFLSFGKESCCPGNAALHDVILALHWVRDNVEAFGGDAGNVTLFGESSGSGMTQLLMMSPLSNNLFHKAILMSGTATSPFLFNQNPEMAKNVFLSTLGLDVKSMNEHEILEKLQNMPAEEIMEGQKNFTPFLFFAPTVDGRVITDAPADLIKSGKVHRMPLMIGCTNSEGTGMLPMRATPGYNEGLKEEAVKNIFIDTFQKIYQSDKGKAAYETVRKLYMENIDPGNPMCYSQLHGEIFSDSVFVVPTVVAANTHAAMKLPTFLYQMTQQPEFNHSEVNGPEVKNRPDFVKCDHADDLHFVWGVPFEEGDLSGGAYFTEDEVELSRQVMKYFTNFATSGNPNEPKEMSVKWPVYSHESDRSHMVLQIPLNTGSNLAMDKVVLFTQTLPNLAQNQ